MAARGAEFLVSQLSLDSLRNRRFSFYPAIHGVQHNEWTLLESTWSEIQVHNSASGQEFWIPRSHLGNVSSTDSPVLIQGLRRELEAKAGGVFPHRKVVTEIPTTAAGRAQQAPSAGAAPPKPIRVNRADARTLRLLVIAISLALMAAMVGFLGVVGGLHNPLEALFEPDTSTADQGYLGLGRNDTYFEVVNRLSEPEEEQWMSAEEDELQFQALHYRGRGYIVIMMGGSRAAMRYLGTLHDPSRRVLDSARLARGGDTAPMMRNLPDF